jgi:hypothetical protein
MLLRASAGQTYPQRLLFIADLGLSYNRCAHALLLPACMHACAHLPRAASATWLTPAPLCLSRSTTTMEHVAISASQATSPTALLNIGDMSYAGEGRPYQHGSVQG